MTLLRLTIAALAGTALGAGATASAPGPVRPATPAETAVIVQGPQSCSRAPVPAAPTRSAPGQGAGPVAALPAAARRLTARGAELTVVCSPEEATVAVLRAAGSGRRVILGEGPDVRAALSLAAVDHPGRRFGPLPGR